MSSTIPSSGSGLKMNSVFKNRKLAHFCFSSSLESPLSNDELEQGFSSSLDVFDLSKQFVDIVLLNGAGKL